MDPTSLDFEAVLGEVPDGGDQPDPDPAPEPAPEGDPPAEATPTAGFSVDDPAFQDAVAQQVAEQMQQLRSQFDPAAAPPAPGDPVDWREVMNPLSDDYDPERFYQARDQYLLDQVRAMVEPLMGPVQQQQQSAADKLVDQFIADRWSEPVDGKLTDDVASAIRDLAPAYLDEMNARFGQGPRAAQQALVKAADRIRAINRAALGTGGLQNIDGLAALNGVPGEPGTSGAAHNVPPPARTPLELLERTFGRS